MLDVEISWNESIHEARRFQPDPTPYGRPKLTEGLPAILSPVSRQVVCQLRVTQSGRTEKHMVRGAPQYPRVPHAPFQINTRVHLAQRDPPSAQTEHAENKCRSPKQINPRAIQNARARRVMEARDRKKHYLSSRRVNTATGLWIYEETGGMERFHRVYSQQKSNQEESVGEVV